MNDTGSTTIEMIAWLPILLLVIATIVQFGLYFNARNACQAAAFESARQAAVSTNPEQKAKEVAAAYAGRELPGWKEGERLETDVRFRGRGRPNETIVVSIYYDTPLFMPRISGLDKAPFGLIVSGRAQMEMEERP